MISSIGKTRSGLNQFCDLDRGQLLRRHPGLEVEILFYPERVTPKSIELPRKPVAVEGSGRWFQFG
jgi:hypothetical protein